MTTANGTSIELERHATIFGSDLVHVRADGALVGTVYGREGSFTVDYPGQSAFATEDAAIAFLVDLFNRVVRVTEERGTGRLAIAA